MEKDPLPRRARTWAGRWGLMAVGLGVVAQGCDIESINPKPSGLVLEDAPEAPAVASFALEKPARESYTAGENAVLAYEERDLGVLDLSDPKDPKPVASIPTMERVLAFDYDEERSVGIAVDVGGTVYVLNMASASGATSVATLSVAGVRDKVTAVARVGDRVFVLADTLVQVLNITFGQDGTPVGLTMDAPLTLSRAALRLAAGAGVLYVGYGNGEVEAWSVPLSGAPEKKSTHAAGGELRGLLAKGSKAMVLSKGVGLVVVDFGDVAKPTVLTTLPQVADVAAAKLFGPTLLVGLEKGYVSTLDLTSFADPKALTTNKGPLPKFLAAVEGNVISGQGTEGKVTAPPPVITGVVPQLIQQDFPVDGQLPVTFSKPVDPQSVSSDTVKARCNDQEIPGTAILAPDRVSVSFRPTAPYPTGANCTLDLSKVRDTVGNPVAAGSQGSRVSFATMKAPSQPVVNPSSKYPHSADGKFTGFGKTEGGTENGPGEWSDVKPAKGMYTYFYADFDGKYLWLMNDWFYNGTNIDPDCYNQFGAWTGGGSERWEIRAYGSGRVEVRRNNVVMDPKAAGVEGGASYGPSPNVKEPHTMYELRIPASAGAWGVQLHDPGPVFHCSRRAGDPSNMQGNLQSGGDSGNAVTVGAVAPAPPVAPALVLPQDAAMEVPLTQTFRWEGRTETPVTPQQGPTPVGYLLQISTDAAFRRDVRSYGTYTTSYTVPRGALIASTKYFWRVNAWNSSGSAPSPVRTFTTMAAPKPNSALLSVTTTGQGTISSEPRGINCGPTCSATFPLQTRVTLTATPAPGFSFDRWYGDCAANAGAPATASVVLDRNRFCSAVFRATGPFTLTVDKNGNGTVVSEGREGISCGNDCNETLPGMTSITLKALPADGQQFSYWTGDCGGVSPQIVVTMDRNKRCVAVFGQRVENVTLTTTVQGPGTGYIATSFGQNCSQNCQYSYALNQQVALTAVPTESSVFEGWSGDCSGIISQVAVQMNTSKTCVAKFGAAQRLTLSVTPSNPAYGSVSVGNQGSCSTQGCTYNAPKGSSLVLTANPQADARFTGWQGSCTSACPQSGYVNGVCTASPLTVPMNGNVDCVASFAPSAFRLNVSSQGDGGGSISGGGIDCVGNTGTCSKGFDPNAQVTLTAQADGTSEFQYWTGCQQSREASITVPMTTTQNCTAVFVRATLSVNTIAQSGAGRGTIRDATGLSCSFGSGTCSKAYAPGSAVTLFAEAADGSTFAQFEGDCREVLPRTSPPSAVVTVSSPYPKRCFAYFNATTHRLSVSMNGTGSGSIVGGGTDCTANQGTCAVDVPAGTAVSITATPDSASLLTALNCNQRSLSSPATLDITGPVVCVATFTKPVLSVGIESQNGGSGTVTDGNALNCTSNQGACSATYPPNGSVTLTATPDANSTFAGFSGSCKAVQPPTNPPTATVPITGAYQGCTALFTRKTVNITYGRIGSGSGSVVLSSGGQCAQASCTSTVAAGSQVTVTAYPESNSTFVGWEGNCTAVPQSNPPTATFSNLTTDGTCTATFNTLQYKLSVVRTGAGDVQIRPSGGVTKVCSDSDGCGQLSVDVTAGTSVRFVALATSGKDPQWSGDCVVSPLDPSIATLTMNGNKTCTVNLP